MYNNMIIYAKYPCKQNIISPPTPNLLIAQILIKAGFHSVNLLKSENQKYSNLVIGCFVGKRSIIVTSPVLTISIYVSQGSESSSLGVPIFIQLMLFSINYNVKWLTNIILFTTSFFPMTVFKFHPLGKQCGVSSKRATPP